MKRNSNLKYVATFWRVVKVKFASTIAQHVIEKGHSTNKNIFKEGNVVYKLYTSGNIQINKSKNNVNNDKIYCIGESNIKRRLANIIAKMRAKKTRAWWKIRCYARCHY